MKKWMTGLAVLMVASAVFAADGWLTDFAKAQAQAKADGKYMLIDFSGSDWCGWCIKLDNEVFSKDSFKAYAAENLVLMMADFPSRTPQADEVKAQNQKLAAQYGVRGYPTVILLAPDGTLAGRTGYQAGGPEKYVEHVKALIKAYESK
jgi:thioredoxin-related protein